MKSSPPSDDDLVEGSSLLPHVKSQKDSQDSEVSPDWAFWCLYGSHSLSAWGARMWEFAIGLIMLELGSGSLMLVSLFGLLDGLGVTLAAPLAGAFIDRTRRFKAASIMYLIQNSTVACSASAALKALLLPRNSASFWVSVGAVVAGGTLSSAGALGATLSVEKEWTKALCGDNSDLLALTNARMRRIDLSCLILSPILVGFMMTYSGTQVAVILILCWNLLAWTPELFLLHSAQLHSVALRQEDIHIQASTQPSKPTVWSSLSQSKQVWLPATSLSLLYLTVLSFGLLSTAYLKWRGMSEAELSIYRGLGAVSGISATFIFPALHARLGLARSGLIGIWWQLLSLAAAVLPALSGSTQRESNPFQTYMFVGGLISSRLGLWLFDLSVNQLLQEEVEPEVLGVVSGVQGSLSSFFQSLSYLIGIILPDPRQYTWLMVGSWVSVLTAAILFSVWSKCHQEGQKYARKASQEEADTLEMVEEQKQ